PWLLGIQRATEAIIPALDRHLALYDAGHLPMWPPNVSGWHGGPIWFASSTTAQRYNLAGAVAAAAPESNPARQAAAERDLAALTQHDRASRLLGTDPGRARDRRWQRRAQHPGAGQRQVPRRPPHPRHRRELVGPARGSGRLCPAPRPRSPGAALDGRPPRRH